MALKLSDLVKKSIEKGYGSINLASEKPWSQGSIPDPSTNGTIPSEHIETVQSGENDKNPSNIKTIKLQQSDNNISNNVLTKLQHSNNDIDNNVPTKLQHSDNSNSNNVSTKPEYSDNNIVTNSLESDNESSNSQKKEICKNGNNVETRAQQTNNNVVAKEQQTDNRKSNNIETKTQQTDNNVGTNRQIYYQESIRKKDKTYLNIQSLSGFQLIIFDKILSMKIRVNKDYFTRLNTTSLARELNIDIRILRVSINRLEKKNILIREPGFMGRNGVCNFRIPSNVLKFKEELDQVNVNFSESPNIYNNSNIITTITNERKKEVLVTDASENNWWDKLNINAIEEYGFKLSQFKQLDGVSKFEIVQESINHFGWGLKYNPKNSKYKDNPSRVLFSVLKRGEAWIEDGYRDPQEIALEKILASKKANIERKNKIEEDLYSVSLQEWIDSLSPSEREKLVLNSQRKGDLGPPKAKLSHYFRENIWPIKKSEYLITSD